MGVNRDIKQCTPRLQQAWAYLAEHYPAQYPEGPKLILVETFRPSAVQTAYYAQGRRPLTEVNELRATAGLAAISATENKRKITNAQAGKSKHEKSPSQAFDIGFVKDGKMDWSSINYQRAARILRDAFPDITWGADWNRNGRSDDERFIDQPHFQVG